MWTLWWKHLNSCHSHSQPTWCEMSQEAEYFQSIRLHARELGCHSQAFHKTSVSFLLDRVSEYDGFIWGWWCWGSCEGQEGSSGTCCSWNTTALDVVQALWGGHSGLDQNSSVAGWLMSHSPPAAVKAVPCGDRCRKTQEQEWKGPILSVGSDFLHWDCHLH